MEEKSPLAPYLQDRFTLRINPSEDMEKKKRKRKKTDKKFVSTERGDYELVSTPDGNARSWYVPLDVNKEWKVRFVCDELKDKAAVEDILEDFGLVKSGVFFEFKTKSELKKCGLTEALNYCELHLESDGSVDVRKFILCSNVGYAMNVIEKEKTRFR